ncbi:MAG: glycosyltransferase [Gracilimonas sp.]|uniref:glycosyltransferase n=1 Tax=Gracilimonas sp. TaxID=1974203 RepID=UPI0037529306|nr:glycosyltransferase [Gracilimonas sp.]
MESSVILITSSFPFGKGESFLETEIGFLSKHFSRVLILPTSKIEGIKKRSLPNNCFTDTSIIQKKNTESIYGRFFSKIFGVIRFPPFYREIKYLFPRRFNTSTFSNLLLFSRDAVLTRKAINNLLNKTEIASQKTILYSYWLNGTALGATYNKKDIPVISRVHRGDLYDNLYSKNYIPYRRITLNKLVHVYPISKTGVNYLANRFPALKDKISLSRLGINIPDKNPAKSTSINTRCIVSCSAIDQNKRVDQIALSLKLFAENNPSKNLTWHHFGDGHLKQKIKSIIFEFPTNLKAVLHGHVQNKKLLDWYRKNDVDLFINLSRSEGIPVSIMEAYGFGIPCIATNVGGTSEIVTKQNGWLIDSPFTVDSISKLLFIALSNESLRFEKAKESKKTCEQFFNSKKNYPQFIHLIKAFI